jgi:hypothetical protein
LRVISAPKPETPQPMPGRPGYVVFTTPQQVAETCPELVALLRTDGTWQRISQSMRGEASPHLRLVGRTRPRARGRRERPAARRAAGARSGSDPGGSDPDLPPQPRRRTPAEIAAERLQVLREFTARWGLDYWDTHTEPPTADAAAQFDLGRAA